MKAKLTACALVAAAALLVSGCSDSDSAQSDAQTSASTTDNGTQPAASDDSEPSSADPSDSTTPTESPAASASTVNRSIPSECSGITLEFGATISGADLSNCVPVALSSYETGRMHMFGEGLDGTIDFTYRPDYEFSLTGENAGEQMQLVLVDDAMWMNMEGSWIKGDLESSDPDVYQAGMIAEMYRALADPRMTAQMIAGGSTWVVSDALVPYTLPNGETVEAFEIANSSPISFEGMTLQDFTLYYGADWKPVASIYTSSFGNLGEASSTQEFFDLGADITISAPQ